MHKDVSTGGDVLHPARSAVGRMFDDIAPTYDLLNHLLSLGRDYAWRRRAAGLLDDRTSLRVADLATGTGDLLIEMLRRRPNIPKAVGLDISARMLARCREKLHKRALDDRAELLHADASATPFHEGEFDAVTMAFGIRNTSVPRATLEEIHRILKPGGAALILEFSLPANRLVRWCHLQYLRFGVPLIGALLSGDRHAYRYLNESIESFSRTTDLSALMTQTGFRQISVVPLTFGVASIYRGEK
jgi:demethylmenaquinone methyltransferase/2-methoxy-6-polyprenyl-1,4-benzoquinol methylase